MDWDVNPHADAGGEVANLIEYTPVGRNAWLVCLIVDTSAVYGVKRVQKTIAFMVSA